VGTLRQGGGPGQQATIVRLIQDARERWGNGETDTLFRARKMHGSEFDRLLDEVEWTLIEMPIPRLQKLGDVEDRFLYTYNWTEAVRRSAVSAYQRGHASSFDNLLRLKPGVGELLVRLNGVLRPLFYREWAVMVARMNRLPEAALEQFLFGAERVPLEAVRRPLLTLQNNVCFYCKGPIGGRADVDHFIPWTRYPDDALDNLVVAHQSCNNSKRDFLAGAEHVERWRRRVREHGNALATIATDLSWPRDAERTRAIATSIYSRLPLTARLWLAPSEFGPHERRRILSALEA
jgi:5-methylcytosine-specific restriction endonuclease McrA